ncbi:DUF892 family protein [Bradyrhizobium pachyrhizi]|uniref:DUF892 family protein n=1 Tax=Bradyrhizobium pachyrhizi TaxID=280333 RepID=UPI003D35FF4C
MVAHFMAGDETLKNTFANNAFEHFEIAAYKSLLTQVQRPEWTRPARRRTLADGGRAHDRLDRCQSRKGHD